MVDAPLHLLCQLTPRETVSASAPQWARMWYTVPAMRPIATNTNDFETLRTLGQIYVDKTAHLHRMITDTSRSYFFCARPRRFGKSLSVTTMKSIFLGHREFFEGLAIAKTDYDWKKYPVIHLNWGKVSVASIERFDESLDTAMKSALTEAGYAYDSKLIPSDNLGNAIDSFAAKAESTSGNGAKNRGSVVILIDEYDDPVAKALADVELAEQIRTRLADVYAQFKDRTDKIRFLYITGVSKFTKLSIFSTLSSLNDISFETAFADLYGYTEEELTANFSEHFHERALLMNLSDEEFRKQLKFWYNGYRFGKVSPTRVYNPVSVALTLTSDVPEFSPSWTATGRPSMLMNFIKRQGLLAIDYEKGVKARENDFDVSDIRNLRAIPMLFQTGYLTITDYRNGRYTLGVPDEEVRRDLMLLVSSQVAEKPETWVTHLLDHLIDGEFDLFFRGLKSLYSDLPYGSTEECVHEMSYERVLKALLQALGLETAAEPTQTGGRPDVVATDGESIWIFELKKDEPADEGLKQIHERGYAEPYTSRGLPIYAFGLSFDSETRQFVEGKVEKLT